MAVPPPPAGATTREFFSFPWAILSLCNRKHESDQNPTYFPEGSFREKNPIAFRNICGPGGYSHTLPIRVCAAQQGRDFEAPNSERGIHFRGVFENGI